MEFESNLANVSHESSFKWKINNLNIVDFRLGFTIKSPKVSFEEANATWFLEVEKKYHDQAYYTNLDYFPIRFSLKHNSEKFDENARYRIIVKTIEASSDYPHPDRSFDSGWLCRDEKGARTPTIEFEFANKDYICLMKDLECVVIEAKCELKTLRYEKRADANLGSDNFSEGFVHVEDSKTIENVAVNEVDIPMAVSAFPQSARNSPNIEVQPVEKIADENLSTGKFSSGSETSETSSLDCSMQDNEPLSINRRIEEIYMVKMRQVAEMSADLLVAAAQINNAHLLEECSRSFAAQLTQQNFLEMWKIAKELNARELQKLVVDFVVKNRYRTKHFMPIDLFHKVLAEESMNNQI